MSDDTLRDSMNRIVRETARWGYDLGKAGHPWLEPRIEWNDDGSFSRVVVAESESEGP